MPYYIKRIFENWRDYLNEMNLGTPTKSTEYTAYVLDEESYAKLSKLAPSEWKIYSNHMTLISPTEQKTGRIPARWFRFKDCLTVVAVAKSDFVMAAKIDLGDIPVPFKISGIPHITIATNATNGGKPQMSNDFSEQDFEAIQPFNVCGKVQEIYR